MKATAAAGRPGQRRGDPGIVGVADGDAVRVAAPDRELRGGVRVERLVPLQVVVGEVEQRADRRRHRRRPVQLEAGQLDREHVIGARQTIESETSGSPMLPTAAVRSPAAARIAASIVVVVVLPLVPVMASQAGAPSARSRHASSGSL